jgi:hypothetical protein
MFLQLQNKLQFTSYGVLIHLMYTDNIFNLYSIYIKHMFHVFNIFKNIQLVFKIY